MIMLQKINNHFKIEVKDIKHQQKIDRDQKIIQLQKQNYIH